MNGNLNPPLEKIKYTQPSYSLKVVMWEDYNLMCTSFIIGWLSVCLSVYSLCVFETQPHCVALSSLELTM